MENSLQLSMDQGVSGVILWGSSASSNSTEKCQKLSDYMRETFGPYTQQVLKKAESCSQNRCNGNGRCYKKDPLCFTDPPEDNEIHHKVHYLCQCYSGWEGDQCDLQIVN